MRTARFWNNLHHVRSKSNDWKAKKSFGRNKTKGPKQDSQYRLRSPMPEGGEALFIVTIYNELTF